MTAQELIKSGSYIAARNISPRVRRIFVRYEDGVLDVLYEMRSEPTEEDFEDCDLTCGEIVAAFPEIVRADAKVEESSQHRTGYLVIYDNADDH